MDCPHFHSSSTSEQEGRTVHGFRSFRGRRCGRRYNERTGPALNRVQVPTGIVFLVVLELTSEWGFRPSSSADRRRRRHRSLLKIKEDRR